MRDKLNIGLFDAAHLIAPVAIASSLGLGHVKVPIVAPFALGVNGNAITVSPALYAAIAAAAEGNLIDPMVSARALARVVANRKARGQDPLTFGMTFPFSTHNYHLRFWMAAGGVDPDEDVRLVVLPPPYMVESLANKHVDALLRRRAVEFGRGRSRHRLHPAFRLRNPAARRREGAGIPEPLGAGTSRCAGAARARARARRGFRRGGRQPRRGRGDPCGAEPHRRRAPR